MSADQIHVEKMGTTRKLETTGIRRILQIELAVKPDSDQRGMTASGIVVINPPWKLE
jgi:23S rRNA (adenine2030-N6)-methyltransferase